MAPEFRELLDRSVQDAPAEPHHVGDVVHRAQRARRRRRSAVAGVSATAVVAVAAMGAVLSGARPWHDDAQPAANGMVGPVVHLGEATRGVVGKDHLVGATYTNKSLDRRNGRLYQQVTDRGEVLVSQAAWRTPGDALSEYTRFALLDPVSGRTSWLPAPPDARYSSRSAPSGPMVQAVAGALVVWTTTTADDKGRVDVFDRSTGTWRRLPVDVAPSSPVAADGRLWYSSGGDLGQGPGSVTRLWSVALDGSGQPRAEASHLGDWAIDGSTLVYSEATNRPISKLTVRDLDTGSETSFDPRSGDRCNQLSISLSGERIALGQYCGTHHGVRDDRVQVVTTSGRPVVTLQDDGIELAGLGKDFVVGSSYGGSEAGPGTYVYDFGQERLVRIADGIGKFSPMNTAGGDVLTWSTPVNHHHGMKIWAGTWR